MRIFVYGSLRKGMYNYDIYLRDNSELLGIGYVKGELYTIKDVKYPALIQGDSLVVGEIYEVNDNLVGDLDAMEHYFGEGHSENEYHRIDTPILNKNGKQIDILPVYWYNEEALKQNLNKVISSRDYVKYMKENS